MPHPTSLRKIMDSADIGLPEYLTGYTGRISVICQVARQLHEGHVSGTCHGNLHPDCILIGLSGQVTLTGWNDPHPYLPLAYRAPEAGIPFTPAMDVYAIGAVLWELLTLQPPLIVEDNLTRFHRRKRAGEQDPLPATVRGTVPADLLSIARRAMSPEPQERFQGVDEFVTALHGWLMRVESVVVTMQAEAELSDATSGSGDAGIAEHGFRSALALWPSNTCAQNGLEVSAATQALHAIEDGNEAIAQRHVGDASGSVNAVVTAAFLELRNRNKRRRQLIYVSFAIIVVSVGIIGLFHTQGIRPDADWRLEREWVLVRDANTSGLEATLRNLDSPGRLPSPSDDGLLIPSDHIIWLKDINGRGDVRLGLEASWIDDVDGLEMMLAVPRLPPPVWTMSQAGYSCQFGGYRGSQTFLSVNHTAGWANRSAPISFAFIPGRVYRLEMERSGEYLRLRVDGNIIWDQREVVPIGDSRFRYLAFRAWAKMRVHRVFVEKPNEPPHLLGLHTADAMAAAGHYADALSAYISAIGVGLAPELRERAIAKAHLVASRLSSGGDQRRHLFQLAMRDIPQESIYIRDVMQAEAYCLWMERDWQESLRLVETLQKRFPESRCAATLLEGRQSGIPESALATLLGLISSGPKISHLNLSGLGLSDLAPLATMQLESLDISGNQISNLAPLRGMQLRLLNCSGNLISDLAPLRGMRLVRLEASNNQIVDLTPLEGMPLEQLVADDNRVSELAPLAGAPVEFVSLERNPIGSVAALSQCVKLVKLRISEAPLASLDGLALDSLTHLAVTNCPITNLRPLMRSRLKALDLSGTLVTDVADLPRTPLWDLRLARTAMASLGSLGGLALGYLDLSDVPLISLDGIADIKFFSSSVILLDRTSVSSLSLLDVPHLNTLSIRDTRVSSLDPLSGRTVNHLFADRIPAEDLSPIIGILQLKQVSLFQTGCSPTNLDALADQLEFASGWQAPAETLRIQAACQAGDWRRLRALAQRIGSYDRLPLHTSLTYMEASAIATAAGARLPCPTNLNDLRALANHPSVSSWFWVGLQPRIDGEIIPRWMHGRADMHIGDMIKPTPDKYRGLAWMCPTSAISEPLLWPLTTPQQLATLRHAVVLEW